MKNTIVGVSIILFAVVSYLAFTRMYYPTKTDNSIEKDSQEIIVPSGDVDEETMINDLETVEEIDVEDEFLQLENEL
jgi:DNA/RNA endonuclease YhcR with UshA esterase domain